MIYDFLFQIKWFFDELIGIDNLVWHGHVNHIFECLPQEHIDDNFEGLSQKYALVLLWKE